MFPHQDEPQNHLVNFWKRDPASLSSRGEPFTDGNQVRWAKLFLESPVGPYQLLQSHYLSLAFLSSISLILYPIAWKSLFCCLRNVYPPHLIPLLQARQFTSAYSPAPPHFPGLLQDPHRSSTALSASSFRELGRDSSGPTDMNTLKATWCSFFSFITSLRLQFLLNLLVWGLVWGSFSLVGKVGAKQKANSFLFCLTVIC